MEPARIWIGRGAEERLSELGIPLRHLTRALEAGDAESRTWTEAAPKNVPGITRWGRTNEYLRIGEDWAGVGYENPGGVPMTISPDGSFRLVATTGDEFTGVDDPKHQPSTRYAKGSATRRAIECNGQTSIGELDEEIGELLEGALSSESLPTWILLYRVTLEGIWAELSFPRDISEKGFIEGWTERIILPRVEFDTAPIDTSSGHEDGGSFDVAVELR
ncbi:hypothetical protein [Actinomadura litoris]|uniref:hypothetical protein n=1 Tax=Actinomadura litoris TaxID=2678616 RepID=UPI001FA7C42C|nr:hypothetical protein [Actinomadura litoris]